MKSKLQKQLGIEFQKIREHKKLTRKEVSKQASMNENSYRLIEYGLVNVTLHTIERIANALGIRVKITFSRKDEGNQNDES